MNAVFYHPCLSYEEHNTRLFPELNLLMFPLRGGGGVGGAINQQNTQQITNLWNSNVPDNNVVEYIINTEGMFPI